MATVETGSLLDQHRALRRDLESAVLESPGATSTELRSRVALYARSLAASKPPPELPADLRPYVDKVARFAYKVVDEDIGALRAAGYSEDAIFELTLAAAVGAASDRMEAVLRAVREASS